MQQQLWPWLAKRENGDDPYRLIRKLQYDQATKLRLSQSDRFQSNAQGGITWIAIDNTEGRYALASAHDASIQCFDILAFPHVRSHEQAPVFHIKRSNAAESGHRAAVTGVDWYPLDNGLFVSCSKDGTAKLWDPNTLSVAASIETFDKAMAISLAHNVPGVAAVACADASVRLLDIVSGHVTQTLSGYSGPVFCVAWSNKAQYQIAAGDANGEVRLHDMRRAGTLHVFDQYDTRTPEAAERDETNDPVSPRHRSTHTPGGHDMLSSRQTHVRAHDRAVTGLLSTHDGRAWISSGTDDAIRLWDSETCQNRLARYPEAFNKATMGRQLALDHSGQVLYHPSGSVVSGYNVRTCSRPLELKGHMATINACCWSRRRAALLTGSTDRNILLWEAAAPDAAPGMRVLQQGDASLQLHRSEAGWRPVAGALTEAELNADAWSSDDDDGSGDRQPRGAPGFSGRRQVSAMDVLGQAGSHSRQRSSTSNYDAGHRASPADEQAGVSRGDRRAGRDQDAGREHQRKRLKRVAERLVRALMEQQQQQREEHAAPAGSFAMR